MTEHPPLLSVRDVSNVYTNRDFSFIEKNNGKKQVLNHVNMKMNNKEIFGLTGKNGCGKTTLARCILGLINYDGEIVITSDSKDKKTQVQMIFQDPGASLNPVKNIGWLIEEPLIIHKLYNSEDRQKKVNEMLTQVGLEPSFKTRRVHELSGGQKQRVCIARSLILQPRLLIADEAISSLDASAGAQILNLFRELNKNTGLAILFISHNKSAVEYLCSKIAVMEKGKITQEM